MCSVAQVISGSLQLRARQVPLSVEFFRQEFWIELPFPSPGNLPNPGIEATSLVSPALAGGFFTTAPPVKPEFQAISELNIIGPIV